MKLLLIGFHAYNQKMYPHLRGFIDLAGARVGLSYFHFRERGYFVQSMMKQRFRPRAWLVLARALKVCIVDCWKLRLLRGQYDTIIAIDHFAYAIASRLLPGSNIVFWSHDIISHDSFIYGHPIVKRYMRTCAEALARNRRLIIQSEERLKVLRQSLGLEDAQLDVLFMPVSLPRTEIGAREISSVSRPRFLQSGGIGAYRCSDRLLEHYQDNAGNYRLYFHGVIFREIQEQLDLSKVQPMVSSRMVAPEYLYQLNDYCDIGFVSYEDEKNSNFYYVSHASGQLVEFLRIGMPVVVMGANNLGKFVEEHGVGIGIGDFSELNDAMRSIADNYQRYSHNCFQCFERIFDLGSYVPRVLEWLTAGD